MIGLAVIERELRAVSRHALTYNLRVVGVLAFAAVLGTLWLSGSGRPGLGAFLFVQFHRILFFAIWCFVPLMTADCISRERREGTLPLLFLTAITHRELVYAKGMVHGLRSLTLWLAVLPVFTICFLAGGVGWPEVVISALINLSSVCLALAAGILASSKTRTWTRALAGAASVALALLLGFLSLLPSTLLISQSTRALIRHFPVDEFGATLVNGMALAMNDQDLWQRCSASLRTGPNLLFVSFGVVTVVSIVLLYLIVRVSAWNVQRAWRDEPTARSLWLKQKLFKPIVFQKQLRRWLRWQLQRNPVGWLEQRSWSGRLVIWSWLAVVGCVYSSLFGNVALYQRSFHLWQSILATLLAGSIAVAAAGSFRRERETGVLELLLVAPLREWQIIGGRVRGIWVQFLPAICLLFGVWLLAGTFLASTNEVPFVLGHAVTFATVPVVGLYFSLTTSNFISALIWTLLLQVVLPEVAWMFCGSTAESLSNWSSCLIPAVGRLLVAGLLAWRLWVRLKTRAFVHGALVG